MAYRGWITSLRAATTSTCSISAAAANRPTEGDGREARGEPAARARRYSREGYRCDRRFHPETPKYPASWPHRLVVGYDPDGDLHDPKRSQGRAVSALCP